ncbi:MAG TPA: hypothetical protein VFP56_04030 [Candidatus Limnocylindrales bacterium]|nr:hypothetical protein [Candidatus Limnocylindrales bacterium]
MSSAPVRTTPSLGRAARGLAWGGLLAVLAASGAGLVGLAWHPPGSPARAELTAQGDAGLDARLVAARADLEQVAADLQDLAEEAKTALASVASADASLLAASLERGDALAASIEARARTLRESLDDLPGDEPDAAMRYSNPVLVRRAATLAAIQAATGLAGSWQAVAARASETSRLTALITAHDTTVVNGIQHGLNSEFKNAVETIDEALAVMKTIDDLRARLVAADDTVLDEWIRRTKAYDVALQHLYAALVKSKGRVTVVVQSARREERDAYAELPPDRRTILVIISEVTRNGLTQAVIAIDEASGRLDEALADVAEASAAPS